MFGSQTYTEGQFAPMPGREGCWDVWCHTGALQVLEKAEYAQFLQENPDKEYHINFANGSAARIRPGHLLWGKLAEIARNYSVMVFPLNWSGKYVPWTGEAESLHCFDSLLIKAKQV